MAHNVKDRDALLLSLLRSLAQEWSREEIERALSSVFATSYKHDDLLAEEHRRSKPMLASEQVDRSKLPEPHKLALRELAARYDRKQFLPTTSDIREFIMMLGYRPTAIKNRSEAFKQLISAFSAIPLDHLNQVVDRSFHSGPSQLGPLSDAISSVAAQIPRSRDPNESK